jgi:hypothetical protein
MVEDNQQVVEKLEGLPREGGFSSEKGKNKKGEKK